MGLLWSPMPVTIVTRSQVVAREDSVPMGVVAGQTIIDSAHKEQEVWLWRNIGLFVGVDLRLNSGRFFAQSNIEYDLYPIENQYGEMVVNRVNISGVNANFTGGVTF
ncbi:MAG: hypothetical protein FJY85_26045 [Deltaproteobacteria bacterium]|nr:hypothetical protein [Deltaproteobacteria bacterium]